MGRLRQITPLLTALFVAFTASAQSRAYAKYDSRGVVIGLFNLSKGEARCPGAQIITGSIRSFRSEIRNSDIDVDFTLVSNDHRRLISFFLKSDAIPRSDIEGLLTNGQRFRVNVTVCRDRDRWIAQEITRL